MVLIHASQLFYEESKKVVLVTGAQGVIGRAAAEHFAKEADATVYGVSRRHIEGLENVSAISADLLNSAETAKEQSPSTQPSPRNLVFPCDSPVRRRPTGRSIRSLRPTSSPVPPLGRARQRRRRTKSSTSPMAIIFAGNSCGPASPGCSRWTWPNPCRCP
jgi:hypothetical protein